jgi:hypothetical protein
MAGIKLFAGDEAGEWVVFNKDIPGKTVTVIKTDLLAEKETLIAKLKIVDISSNDAKLLEWAKANWTGSQEYIETTRLTERLAEIKIILKKITDAGG